MSLARQLPPPRASPEATDPITRLQLLVCNSFQHVVEILAQMPSQAPLRDVEGRVIESSEGRLSEEKYNEWLIRASDVMGLTFEMMEAEIDRLPTSRRELPQLREEVRRLQRLNDEAKEELVLLHSKLTEIYEAIGDEMRRCALSGMR